MITLKTYDGENISASDDAILYDKIIGASGIIDGCNITHQSGNILNISNGRMIIKGRIAVIKEENISVNVDGTNGRLIVHMELNNATEPIKFVTQSGGGYFLN